MANKRKNKDSRTGLIPLLLPALIGVLTTAVLAVVLTLTLGKIAYNTADPAKYSGIIGSSALYLSVFSGGLISTIKGGKSFKAAILHAIVVTAILIFCGLGSSFSGGIIRKLLVVPCSLLGGALCQLRVGRQSKPKFKSRSK